MTYNTYFSSDDLEITSDLTLKKYITILIHNGIAAITVGPIIHIFHQMTLKLDRLDLEGKSCNLDLYGFGSITMKPIIHIIHLMTLKLHRLELEKINSILLSH